MKKPYDLNLLHKRLLTFRDYMTKNLKPDLNVKQEYGDEKTFYQTLYKSYKFLALVFVQLEHDKEGDVFVTRTTVKDDDLVILNFEVNIKDKETIVIPIFMETRNDTFRLEPTSKLYITYRNEDHLTYKNYDVLLELLRVTKNLGCPTVADKTKQHMFFIKEGLLDDKYLTKNKVDLKVILTILSLKTKHNLYYFKKLFDKHGINVIDIMNKKRSYKDITAEDKLKYLKARKTSTIMDAATDIGFSTISTTQKIVEEVTDLLVNAMTFNQKNDLILKLMDLTVKQRKRKEAFDLDDEI